MTASSRRDNYVSEIEQITDVVGLDDLTMPELLAIAELLRPALTRFLAGYRPPELRVVR